MWSDILATQRKCKGLFHWLWDTFIWVNQCTRRHYRIEVASHYRLEGHPKQTPLSGLCLCVGKHFNTISLQLTKDMLDSHQRIPYPPMIKLEIQPTTLNLRSTEVPVEIVGIREAGKTFILNPKLRPGQQHAYILHTLYHLVSSVVYCGASLMIFLLYVRNITYNFDVHMCNTPSNNHWHCITFLVCSHCSWNSWQAFMVWPSSLLFLNEQRKGNRQSRTWAKQRKLLMLLNSS